MKITFDGINCSFNLGKIEVDCSPEEIKTLCESEVEKTRIYENSDSAVKAMDTMVNNMMANMKNTLRDYIREEFAKRDTVISSNPNQCTRPTDGVVKYTGKGRSTKEDK